jgi:hypothetical protein
MADLKVNAALTGVTDVRVDGALTQVTSVKVDAAKTVIWTSAPVSDPLITTYVADDSNSYLISGGGYTGAQLTQRGKLMYYGRSSTRYEGALAGFDESAIQAMLALRPVCSSVKVRITYQHAYNTGNDIELGFHGEATLPTNLSTGWVTPSATEEKTVAVGKSTSGIRLETEWTGTPAQDIADNFGDGTWKGIGIHIRSGAAVNDWGWCGGAIETSSGESGGIPSGYSAVTTGREVQILFDCDYI